MKITDIRAMFPALSRKVYGKDLVYFDNAATSQRVQTVLDEWNRISAESNANIHRAVHRLADEATQAYEQARDAGRKSYLQAALLLPSIWLLFLSEKHLWERVMRSS